MLNNDAWEIFKKTGSVEAYITFSQTKNTVENQNGGNDKEKRDNIENKRHSG